MRLDGFWCPAKNKGTYADASRRVNVATFLFTICKQMFDGCLNLAYFLSDE